MRAKINSLLRVAAIGILLLGSLFGLTGVAHAADEWQELQLETGKKKNLFYK